MYKKILAIFTVLILTLPLCAQKKGELIRKGTGAIVSERGGTQVGRQVSDQVMRQVAAGTAGAAMRSAGTSVSGARRSSSLATTAPTSPVHSNVPAPAKRGMSGVPSEVPDLSNIDELVGKIGALRAENEELKTVGVNGGFGRSVLFAPLVSTEELGYSVTVFETSTNGTREIFGLLPSHSLPYDYYHAKESVSKQFQVKVKLPNGTERFFPAEVVQISPESMLDISLVKLSPEAESFVSPLQLAETNARMNEKLHSYGFAAAQETEIDRTVNNESFLSVRTNQAIEGDREGFCGSPLLDMQGRIKAIHTGTVEGNGTKPDVSYGTHVSFIRTLLEGYYNNGVARYDLVLNEHAIANLNVDEYISAFYLFNEQGKRIVQQNFDGKFSQSTILNAIKDNPEAAYLQLTSRTAQWVEDRGVSILQENRGKTDKTKRQHWYNLQTHQIEPQRPAIIKL